MGVAALNSTGRAVYATVSYADVSNMPIQLDHLHRALIEKPLTLLETSMAVDDLVEKGYLERRDDLIHLAGRAEVLSVYERGLEAAPAAWRDAVSWGERIGRIPLVRMVAVTGNLAAFGSASESQVGFLVMVRPRRLWMARLMIQFIVRAARLRKVTIGTGYLATTRAPEVEQRSLPIAWELAHMATIVGEDVCQTFRRSNQWVFDWLPNAGSDGNLDHVSQYRPSGKQKWIEFFLLLPPFKLFEKWTQRRQTALLARSAPADGVIGSANRHSTEVCDESLGALAAAHQTAWAQRLTDFEA